MSRSNPTEAAGYHHGALREALLDAAEAILLEGGVEAFTLRECARRAGVSHAAPAHHFGDARGLLTAFATVGFDRLADLMERYRTVAGPEAGAQLTAVGRAYIDFALRHRAHFQLMFRRDRLQPDDPELGRAGARSAGMLQETMAATIAAAGIDPAELPTRMLLAWSAVHGYATLAVEGQLSGGFGISAGDPKDAGKASALGRGMLELLRPALAR